MTKVTVVMPVYGVEKYVAMAVQSVLDQSFTDFEFLIIDDCSPDSSIEICAQFEDARIRIIRHDKNRGLAGARNTGIRYAQGQYIAFLDSDDAWQPEKLQQHVVHLDNNPLIGLSFSRSEFIDEGGARMSTCQMPRLDFAPAEHLLCRNPIGNGSAPVVRQEVFNDIRFHANNGHADHDSYFDESLRQSEDIECWIRIRLQSDWRIEGLTEPLTLYRLNAGGLSANIPKQLETWERVIEKTRAYAPELIAQHGQRARAFQLRYLARQAIRLGDGDMAVRMFHQSLSCDASILIKEPSRTLSTGIAAYLQRFMPERGFQKLLPVAIASMGMMQKVRIRFYDRFKLRKPTMDSVEITR